MYLKLQIDLLALTHDTMSSLPIATKSGMDIIT